MSDSPYITCPCCHKKSYSQGDIENKFCRDCGFHDDLPKSIKLSCFSKAEN